MLAELIDMRQKCATAISKACEISANGGGAGSVPKEQHDAVVSENKKLKVRVKHLLRALDEVDGGHQGSGAKTGQAGAAGNGIKLYTLPLGTPEDLTTILQVVCRLTG